MWIYSITVFYNTLKLNHIILYHIWYLQHDKLPFYIYSRILPVLISSCCIEFNHYKTWIHSITVFYNTLMQNRNHSVSYLISATWWTNSTIYILEHSQYWFQHAALNLKSKSCEFTLLQCSTTLSSIITSFCIIFDICNTINYLFIYIPEYSQYWFQHAVLNLIATRREFTLLQYSTTLSSIIASFCIIFDICYMINQQYCVYSRLLPVLISTCCIEFNHLKLWIYSITVFYNTLKLNHIILYHIWYLQHDEPTVLYIFQNTPSIDISMP